MTFNKKEYQKEWRLKNKEYYKEWFLKNKQHIRNYERNKYRTNINLCISYRNLIQYD